MENYFGAGNYHLDYTPFPKGSPILLDDAVKFVYQRYELGTSYQEGLHVHACHLLGSDHQGQERP